ncbi:DUF6634 family protein [Mycoplana dimorpha]|uniref:DUF6634 family protein n=1 Tax=Mycoplana dimorpha TaxID=28320 RepID=UPI000D36F74A|nr:DUF6634 family protein [Mycoplana dimorpha]
MAILFGEDRRIVGDIAKELERHRGCVAALEAVLERGGPREEDLEGAPLLSGFSLATRAATCLQGQGYGHPNLGTQWTTTSPLIALSLDLNVAKTWSRWFRLQHPADDLKVQFEKAMSR